MAEDNKKALDTLFSYCVELRSKFTHNWASCELLQIKDYVASFRQLDDRLLRLNGRFLEALRWDYSLLSSSVSSLSAATPTHPQHDGSFFVNTSSY